MASVLVISFSYLRSDPRVTRHIQALSSRHELVSCGYGPAPPGVHRHIAIEGRTRTRLRRVAALIPLKAGMHEWYYWSHPRIRAALDSLSEEHCDLILACDLATLPLALRIARTAPVLFDAHEFAPCEYEDRWTWRYFLADYNDALCRRYLGRAAGAMTVCNAIADRFARDYGVKMDVITNAASAHRITPRETDPERIRMIHHGAAIPSRRTEVMIELMNLLDSRFTLDMLLVPGDARYIARLKRRARANPRIRFIEKVEMEQLIAVSTQYDIGLFLLPPSSFNYHMALPNKFFEFIQARLAIAIGPSPEMARLVHEFKCGIVADDFTAATLAAALNKLTAADVDRMKCGADIAARALTAETNDEKLRSIVDSMLARRHAACKRSG